MTLQTINGVELDDFTVGYLECLLWCGIDLRTGASIHETSDFDLFDVDPSVLRKAKSDCEDFQRINAGDLDEYSRDDEYAGHDFYLTREEHGTGFWDRGEGAVGDRLAAAARVWGEAPAVWSEDRGDDGWKILGDDA